MALTTKGRVTISAIKRYLKIRYNIISVWENIGYVIPRLHRVILSITFQISTL